MEIESFLQQHTYLVGLIWFILLIVSIIVLFVGVFSLFCCYNNSYTCTKDFGESGPSKKEIEIIIVETIVETIITKIRENLIPIGLILLFVYCFGHAYYHDAICAGKIIDNNHQPTCGCEYQSIHSLFYECNISNGNRVQTAVNFLLTVVSISSFVMVLVTLFFLERRYKPIKSVIKIIAIWVILLGSVLVPLFLGVCRLDSEKANQSKKAEQISTENFRYDKSYEF